MVSPSRGVDCTRAVSFRTWIVAASSRALSSFNRAAKDTIQPFAAAGAAGVVSRGGGGAAGFVLSTTAARAALSALSAPGKRTGWSSDAARGRKPLQAKLYQ